MSYVCAKHIEETDKKTERKRRRKKGQKIELRNENSYCVDESVQCCGVGIWCRLYDRY